jgi:hypothetical protein
MGQFAGRSTAPLLPGYKSGRLIFLRSFQERFAAGNRESQAAYKAACFIWAIRLAGQYRTRPPLCQKESIANVQKDD